MNSISKGAQVYAEGLPIGNVSDIRASKNADTIFLILKIRDKVRIPKESQFYLDEALLGSSVIKVEFSKEDMYLTSKDISIGAYRPFPRMSPSQIDSSRQQLRLKFSSPKIDSVKNK